MSFNSKERSVAVLVILTLLSSVVWAGPVSLDGFRSTRLIIRGAAETFDDAAIATNYGLGSLGLGVGIVQPLWGPLALDVEFTYKRFREGGKNVSSEEYKGRYLQVIPISALIEFRAPISSTKPIELFVGSGPVIVTYAETQQRTDFMTAVDKYHQKPGLNLPSEPTKDADVIGDVIRGARPCVEVRAGIRIDTGFIQPTMAPSTSGAVKGVELEIYGARRFTSTSNGFNLNTWRLAVGLGLRF
jgi:hypothetical protein